MRPAPVPPDLLRGPFRVVDALAGGVSIQTLRGDRFRAPFTGVRVPASLEDTVRLRAAAALLVLPAGSVLSCLTAAELRQLPLPAASDWPARPVDLRCTRTFRGATARPGSVVFVRTRTVPSVQVQGLPMSTPTGMFVELASHLSLLDLVTSGTRWYDAAGPSSASFARRPSRLRVRGARLLRRAAELARPRVDSPMETAVRLLVVLAGLPCPEPGFRVIVDGELIGVVDLALPEYRIVIEYDGDLHRTLKKKWRSDVSVRDALRDLGWTVIVLTWDDYAVTPLRTVGRVARALARAGCATVPLDWRGGAVGAGDLGDEWHTAFPGRGHMAWDWADAPPA